MPSDLQRVARGLVDSLDEVPQVVAHLQRTALRCRENAQVALAASHGRATVAAQQLDAAARACEAAAHYLLLAPPKARAWAEALIGSGGPSTNRLSSDSADRNKTTGGSGDLAERDSQGRTKRLTASYEDIELPEENEPPLIKVARKAFETFRKAREKDDEELPEDPLEVEILVTETGEIEFEERNEKEDQKREDRLLQDFEITVDLTESVKDLLAAMSESANQQWTHATLTITTDRVEATFDYPEEGHPQPIVVDINLPDLPTVAPVDFDPAFDLRPLGPNFAPGIHDPQGSFNADELEVAKVLERQGWRIDARPPDHDTQNNKNPDAALRRNGTDDGLAIEFKTLRRASLSAVKRNMLGGTAQATQDRPLGEVIVDGRTVGLTQAMADRAYRMARGQPGKAVARVVHVILGDGRLLTYTKEQ